MTCDEFKAVVRSVMPSTLSWDSLSEVIKHGKLCPYCEEWIARNAAVAKATSSPDALDEAIKLMEELCD